MVCYARHPLRNPDSKEREQLGGNHWLIQVGTVPLGKEADKQAPLGDFLTPCLQLTSDIFALPDLFSSGAGAFCCCCRLQAAAAAAAIAEVSCG